VLFSHVIICMSCFRYIWSYGCLIEVIFDLLESLQIIHILYVWFKSKFRLLHGLKWAGVEDVI